MGLLDNVKKQVSKTTDSVVKGAGKLGADAAGAIADTGNSLVRKTQEAFTKKAPPNNLICPNDAMKIVYYVMAADGKMDKLELKGFDNIGKQVDPKFKENKKEIEDECKKTIKAAKKNEEYLDILLESVVDIIKDSAKSSEGSIPPKLLLWNLIVIAFAEGKYSKTEKRIIHAVARRTKIDSTIVKEMENSVRTVQLIEKEETALRGSKKIYSEVDTILKELGHRKEVIMESAFALIND